MIITEQKPIAEIIDSLQDCGSVFLVGCGECATTCKTGGKDELAKLAQELSKQGKKVVGSCIPSAPCIAAQIKVEFAKNMASLRSADAILVLSCGLGAQSAKDNDRLGKTVVPGCNTICGAVVDAQNNFFEKCSMCGDCVLGITAGICPITLCPKGLLNGPCGGMDKGKCEVDKDKDCAWVLIYNELAKKGKTGSLKTAQGPKDFKKATKPHKIMAVP
jgi:ferredoxin